MVRVCEVLVRCSSLYLTRRVCGEQAQAVAGAVVAGFLVTDVLSHHTYKALRPDGRPDPGGRSHK